MILGAGPDTRAWRLPQLARTAVREIGHPASQQDEQARLTEAAQGPQGPQGLQGLQKSERPAVELPVAARSVRSTPVDLSVDDLGAAPKDAGHDPSVPTPWLREGVIPYLTPHQVRATLAALTAPGSALIVNYQTPPARTAAGRLLTRMAGSANTSQQPGQHGSTEVEPEPLLAYRATGPIPGSAVASPQKLSQNPRRGRHMFTTSGGGPRGRSVRIVHELRQQRLPVLSDGTRLSRSR
ncbi:class I SAM-dependent methyltransferase [Streptomyces sp. NPDC048527]|uniref:class I SAM-dependent methyltransferase n=1 Tax=Streptomyces sp. NPDC048527 TaxID=3365568 RepID=UPI00370F8274